MSRDFAPLHAAMKYQSFVDGLRGVAVLSIVWFHIDPQHVTGGYVGVDVFFVISGYLIAGVLRGDLEAGRFSLWRFYERRIRRIVPALFVLLAVMLLVGTTVMLPSEFSALGRNTTATALFVSNIAYWKTSDYFHRDSESNPLLHTWSLSVEEQFYLVVPIMLWAAFRYGRNALVPLLWALFAASFLLSVWLVERAPSFAFFMAPTRMWEFLAGSLLAFSAVRPVPGKTGNELVGLAGILLLAWSIFAYTENTSFPGLGAVPPVLGTCLIIHAGSATLVARLLSLRPLVLVGLISYSLYLWHWPVLIYFKYLSGHDGSQPPLVPVLTVSFVLALLSWRFVEQPFRAHARFTRGSVYAGASAALGAVVGASLTVYAQGGWPARFPDAVTVVERSTADFSPMRARCHSSDERPVPVDRACIYGSAVPPSFAIWGDSHAVELAYALGEVAATHGRSILHLSYSACPPALEFDGRASRGCDRFNEEALHRLLATSGIRTVFLVARYDAEAYVGTNLADGMRAAVADLVRDGKQVVLVSPIPSASMDVPRLLAHKLMSLESSQEVTISRAGFDRANQATFSYLASLQAEYGTQTVQADKALCDATSCDVSRGGRALYFDDIHPSLTGARLMARLFEGYFR